MPNSITSLPLDLLNVIADDLDTNSLRALALASPAFLAATRRILFQTLSVDGRRPSRIQAFEDFLHNAPQQVRAAVRTLRFIDTAASSSSSRSQPIPTRLIDSVLECLPFLTHLILRSANIRNALPLREIGADAHSGEVAPPQRDLECLEFRAMTLKSGTLDDYRAVLSIFRSLGTLRIVSCEWPGESGAGSDALQCTSALAVSRLEVRGQWDVLEWLTLLSGTRTLGDPETGEEPTLREIDVMCRSVGDTQTLGTFLRAAGSNVREFACHIDGPFDGRDEPESDSFIAETLTLRTSCPRLEILVLHLGVHHFEPQVSAKLPRILANVLAVARSTRAPLKQLNVVLDCVRDPSMALSRLDALWRCLFTVLRDDNAARVHIICEIPKDTPGSQFSLPWYLMIRSQTEANLVFRGYKRAGLLSIGFGLKD